MDERTERMIADFSRSLEASGIRSRGEYLAALRAFLGFCRRAGYSWTRLAAGAPEQWVAELLGPEANAARRRTVNGAIGKLKKWGAWACRAGVLAANPFADLPRLRVSRPLPKTVLGVEEVGALLSGFRERTAADSMARAVLELLYGSGLRISEAVSIRCQDIAWEERMMRIREKKTGAERRVPATETSLACLRRYMSGVWETLVDPESRRDGFIFPQKGSTTIRTRLNSILARECRRLALPVITCHGVRHSIATQLLKKGAGIRHIQAFLGHRRIGTTQIYTRVCKGELQKVIEACHPLEDDRRSR